MWGCSLIFICPCLFLHTITFTQVSYMCLLLFFLILNNLIDICFHLYIFKIHCFLCNCTPFPSSNIQSIWENVCTFIKYFLDVRRRYSNLPFKPFSLSLGKIKLKKSYRAVALLNIDEKHASKINIEVWVRTKKILCLSQ